MTKRAKTVETIVLWLVGIWASMLGLRFALSIFSDHIYVPNHVDLFIDWIPLCALGFMSLGLVPYRLIAWAGLKR